MADVLYEVEQIVGKKITPNRRVLYLVRWKGFTPDHDSWEPAGNLDSCRKLLAMYNSNDENPVIREDGPPKSSKANPVIREDGPPKSSKANTTPKQDGVKNDRQLTAKLTEKERNLNKEDAPQHKIVALDSSTPADKGPKVSKENQKRSSSSKLIQADLVDVPRKISVANHKLSASKKSKPLPKVLSCDSTTTNAIPQNHVKNSRISNGKKEFSLTPESSLIKKTNQKRKLPEGETEMQHQGPSLAKKQKLSQSKVEENINRSQDKSSQSEIEDVVDLTKSEASSNCEEENHVREQIEISDDDENVLYSLNSDCDLLSNDSTHKEEEKKTKKDNDNSKVSVIAQASGKANSAAGDEEGKSGGKKKKRMSLIESKKAGKSSVTKPGEKSDSVRSVTPPPLYTSVKDMMGEPTNPDPSKPSGNSLPDPVSPEASETYLADVPSSFPVPAEEPQTDEPLSPSSMLYKSLLDSLPDQLHPMHKGNGKKSKGDNRGGSSNGFLGKSLFNPSSGKGVVERRTSVRSTECAFRYKQIVVKKCARYTQIWLNTTTVMKNALNPLVIQEIVSALNSAKYDDSHLVLFSGLGNVFCSGTDLHYLVSGDRAVAARQMAEKIRELTKTFITFPKPIIAAVSGAAVGMGVALLAVCDVVYASDKASFHLPYSQLSQTPEGCSSFTLPLTVGLPAANELLYGGRKITAMEAYQLGLVSQVFWPTLMMQEIIPRAQNMAACSSKALEATKLLVRSHHRTKMELTNETECNLLLESWFSVECQQSIEAYISNEKNLSF